MPSPGPCSRMPRVPVDDGGDDEVQRHDAFLLGLVRPVVDAALVEQGEDVVGHAAGIDIVYEGVIQSGKVRREAVLERDERLALKRARGESYRAIAAAEGVDPMTVYRAVARSQHR